MNANFTKHLLEKLPPIKSLDHHMKEVVEGSSISFIVRILAAGLGFGFNILIARLLGAEGAGIYFLSLTVITITSIIGRLGLTNALLRFTASSAAVEDWPAVKGVSLKGLIMSAAASGILTLVIFFTSPWLAKSVFTKPELADSIRWMSLAIVPLALLSLYSQLLRGLKSILKSELVQSVGIPSLSILCLYLFVKAWGVMGSIWAYNLATFFTAFAGYLLWRTSKPQLRKVSGNFETLKILKSSIPLFWISVMHLLMSNLIIFLLGVWRTNTEVGIFSVALRTSLVPALFLISINSIAAPKFAELFGQGDIKNLGSMAGNSTKMMILLALPLLMIFMFFPGWVMGLFGHQFIDGSLVLIILCLGQLVSTVAGPVSPLLMMTGNERLERKSVSVSLAFNAILGVILIPHYGIVGAAIATATGVVVKNILSSYLIWYRLQICIIPFCQFNSRDFTTQ
jgi:O-antigen/teichoic acid export membrane protein